MKRTCFSRMDGVRLVLDVYQPPGAERFPVILQFYGAGRRDLEREGMVSSILPSAGMSSWRSNIATLQNGSGPNRSLTPYCAVLDFSEHFSVRR